MKSSNIGGQAVLEGIMMKNRDLYAVAVRKPDQEIEVDVKHYQGIASGNTFAKIPFVRGVFNFIDSLILGMRTLMYSASFFEEEEETQAKKNMTEAQRVKEEKKERRFMTAVMILSVFLALGLFMVLPYWISNLLGRRMNSRFAVTALEGAARLLIFLGYLLLVSRTKDIQRTFMYHGAEHKCINCIEHGMELTVENVRKSSRQHKRCGTSFLFFVMLVSIVLCFFITAQSQILRIVIRLLLVPVIAGISYEIIRLAGRSENVLVNLLSKPGLLVQNLTTKEPDDGMIEVGIKAVEAVFDWRAYLEENFPAKSDEENV
ncbi:DUF1385 domain-containing protein [Dorea sp. OM02-2LB]|nr:DUF1385 domain-containing protein [Dorea sp. OM02-2LB]